MANIKIARFWSAPAEATEPSPKPVDSLEAFGSEAEEPEISPLGDPDPGEKRVRRRPTILAVVVVALTATGAAAYWRVDRAVFRAGASQASLTLETTPAGAEVLIGGIARGKTPLTLAFPAGEQSVDILLADQRRSLRIPLASGATVVHHLTFHVPAVPVPTSATLRITTEPSRLRVSVDGTPRGVSPLVLDALTAGSHTIQVAHPSGLLTRTVDLRAGETTSLLLSRAVPAAEEATGGWLAVTSQERLQLLENGQVIGTTEAPRVMLPAGRHEIELANETLGFRERRTVQIAAGGTLAVRIDLPQAPLSINAQPWAEVSIDGNRLGETPIGNHPVTLGSHEVVFRHPQFGERRQRVVVTTKAPARVSVDLRKP